jgi:hypothetical protein
MCDIYAAPFQPRPAPALLARRRHLPNFCATPGGLQNLKTYHSTPLPTFWSAKLQLLNITAADALPTFWSTLNFKF